MQSICTKYAYNYKHNDASLKGILTELAKADLVRTLNDTFPPSIATANLVAVTIEQLKTMTGKVLREQYNKDNTVSDFDTESAYGATTDDASVDTKSKTSRRNRKGRKAKDKDKSDARKENTDGWTVVTSEKCNSNKLTVTKKTLSHYTMPTPYYHFPITPP